MSYKLLEQNGVTNENVDGAGFNYFAAGKRDGILGGILNECAVYSPASNIVSIKTGVISVQGFRVKITSDISWAASGNADEYSIVFEIVLNPDRSVSSQFIAQPSSLALVKDDLLASEKGTHQIEVIRFNWDGDAVSNISRRLPVIIAGSGSGGGSIELAQSLSGNEEDKAPSVKAVNEGLAEKVDKSSITQSLSGNEEDKAPSVKAVNEGLDKLGGRIARNDKRITNIEQGIPPELFETDSSVAYTKEIPEKALPFAEISKIGGMTYKDSQTLKSAKVSSVESVGANLCSGMSAFSPSVSVSDGVATQIINDNKPTFEFVLQAYNKYSYVENIINATPLGTVGRYSWNFVKDNSFDDLAFGHNGSTVDVKCITNAKHLINGETYTFSFELTNATQGSFSWKDVQINKGSTTLPYRPYFKRTLPIPETVQALDGYGWGVNDTCYNYIDFEKKQFVKRVKKVVFDGSADENITIGMRGTEFTLFKAEISGGYSFSPAITNRDIPYKVAFDANDAHFYVNEGEMLFALSNIIATDVATLKTYLASNPIEVIYELAEPIVTDISDILPSDNFIEVEGGGIITAVNESGFDVPSEITYMLEEETI